MLYVFVYVFGIRDDLLEWMYKVTFKRRFLIMLPRSDLTNI